MSKKFNYKTHKNYKLTSDGNKKNSFYYELPKTKNNLPHGEEEIRETSSEVEAEKRKKTPLIVLNTNQDEVIYMLEKNMPFFALDDGEEVVLSENENEELEMINEILSEELKEQEKASTIRKSFSTTSVTVKTDIQSINNIISEFEKNMDSVDFDTPVEMGEVDYIEYLEDDFADDTIADIDNIEFAIGELANSMIDDGFMDGLNNIDFASLQSGAINAIEIEESEDETATA